jgi:hypothetical protein
MMPAAELLARPDHSIRTICGQAVLTYDPVTATGIVYRIADARWHILQPVGFAEFAATVASCGYDVPDCEETARWLAAVTVSAFPTGTSAH